MSAGPHQGVDVLRKLVIVAVLVTGYVLLHRYAVADAGFDPRGMLALGFVILAAYTVGQLVEVIRLPHITGYLLAGLVLGPSMAHALHALFPAVHLAPPFDEGVLNERVKDQLLLFDDLALALIALTAGGELKLSALRTGIRQILGVTLGQVVALGVAVPVFIWMISGPIPWIALPQLSGLGTAGALAVGVVVASISLATSPAATIAVINSTGAKGDTTTTVLSVVVLKDVLVVTAFSAATAVATGVLGLGGGEGGFLGSLGHILGSIVVGAGIGGVLHLYLRFVAEEVPLFLVGLIYLATVLGHHWHLEAALMFIAAGFVTSNFSSLGETLIHEVERLSLPVYVVFFTLAGAKLHLDVLWAMAAFALGLVAVRVAAIYAGTRAGALVGGGGVPLQNHGWMGFVSQAGLAITLAGSLIHTYEPLGEGVGNALFSLVLGGVAINEMAGPVLLQWGLSLVGDVGEEPEEAIEEVVDVVRAPVDDSVDLDGEDPWGPPLESGVVVADRAVADLESELREVVYEVVDGPLEVARAQHEAYVHDLRRDFLRGHRRAMVAARTEEITDDALVRVFLDEVAALGDAWRDRVLDRAARARAWSWSPGELIGVLDEVVVGLPESVVGTHDPASMAAREESLLMRTRRGWMRLRVRMLGSEREINVRALARYHLGGRGPARLEGVAALMTNEESHLAGRTSATFAVVARAWEHAAELIGSGEVGREELIERLAGMRLDVEADFEALQEEVAGGHRSVARRLARVLGHLVCELKEDIQTIGTVDLPHRRRRYGRVYHERNAGLRALTSDLAGARRTVGARMAAVALDLELVGLEGRIHGSLEEHADHLGRELRGRGPVQLDRVDEALGRWLQTIGEAVVDTRLSAQEFAALARKEAQGLEHLVQDALRAASRLRADLAGDEAVGPLVGTLLDAAQSLTDWYTIPARRVPDGDWNLPAEVETIEVPFREVTVAWFESQLARELSNRAWAMSDRAGAIVDNLSEVDRVIAFNVELAVAELDLVAPDEPIPQEQRELVGEMLIGAVGRSRARLLRFAAELEGWPEEGEEAIRSAVLDAVHELRGEVVDGDFASLGKRLFGDTRIGRRLLPEKDWRGSLRGALDGGMLVVLDALGADRVEAIRQALGILPPPAVVDDLREVLAPPVSPVELPVVYLRLFSERALDAGDLIVGREPELEAISAALDPICSLRTAAVVGLRGTGASSLVSSVARSWPHDVRRIDLTEPATVEQVEAWFAGEHDEVLTVLSGLRWMFELRPGGFAPLQTFARLLSRRPEQAPWLLHADVEVWATAAQRSSLADAIGTVIRLEPLSAEDLESAVLARHQMSGYDLIFDASEDLGWQLWHLLLRGTEGDARQRRAWFQTLHEASGGVMHDALRLWLASIREVDIPHGVIRVGSVPRPPVARLFALDDAVLLLLVQVVRQGWIDADLYAALFRVDPPDATVLLASLAHRGLLSSCGEGRFQVARHLRNPVQRALRARGWT